eukprot:scaffold22143_cov41-Cyclotella_meneghiniana.AAC.11
MARGHKKDDLLPIFERAEINATKYLRRTEAETKQMAKDKWKQSRKQVFFHLQYHPEDPQTREIQKLWRDLVSDPPGETPLCNLTNGSQDRVGISKLVVVYSRPLNLRNRFTVCDIHCRGKPVSEYLAE